MNIVVVDDDTRYLMGINKVLRAIKEANIIIFDDGEEFLDEFESNETLRKETVILIIDINMYFSGMKILEIVKSKFPDLNASIIMMSANRTVDEKVILLEMGADDYYDKSINPKELISRLKTKINSILQNSDFIMLNSLKNVQIDETKLDISINDTFLNLTSNEYKILRYLINNQDKYITPKELNKTLFDFDDESTDNIRPNISRIRSKIREKTNSQNEYIINSKIYGYKFINAGI